MHGAVALLSRDGEPADAAHFVAEFSKSNRTAEAWAFLEGLLPRARVLLALDTSLHDDAAKVTFLYRQLLEQRYKWNKENNIGHENAELRDIGEQLI